MASNATIGSLRVALGLDSAQFDAGLKSASAGLASFGRTAVAGLKATGVAAGVAAVALGVATKRAIDYADAIDEASQKTGIAATSLSRLAHTAKVEGIGLDGLTAGLARLTRGMADVASGSTGPVATAFQALGISVTDATGRLRDADTVFIEIADGFAKMEEGPTKAALAMQLFGKSGTDLIPMLNYGAEGLGRMAAEADRFAVTVNGATAAAAGEFNDTLTRVGLILDGVAIKVASAALPALQSLASTLASPEFASAAQTLSTTLVAAFDVVVQAVVATTNAVKGFLDWMNGLDGGSSRPLANDLLPGQRLNLADDIRHSSANPLPASSLYAGFGFGANGQMNVQKPTAKTNDIIFTDTAGSEAAASRLEALRQSLMTEEQLEMDSHLKRLAEIKKFYADGAIAKTEQDALIEAAHQQHSERMTEITQQQVEAEQRIRDATISGVASVFGSLSALAEKFGDKNLVAAKAFGVAEAVINTAQGITKALTLPPPASWAQAAAVAAAGAAQIGTIMSAQPGNSSKPSVNGSGADASVAPEMPTTARSISLSLQGDYYSRGSVESLWERLSAELGVDGLELIAVPKQS